MDITHDNVCSSMLSCFYSHLLSTGRPISSCPQTMLEKIDKVLFNFLWGKKPSKIKRETVIADFFSLIIFIDSSFYVTKYKYDTIYKYNSYKNSATNMYIYRLLHFTRRTFQRLLTFR